MPRKFLAVAAILYFASLSSVTTPLLAQVPADSAGSISLEERVLMASRIYHIVSSFFPDLSQTKFEAAYAEYLRAILRTQNRIDFDLASMQLIAGLHDGHSWFYDNWLDAHYGEPTGFLAYPLANGQWTVVHSSLDSLKVGDVITTIDSTSMADFFAQQRKYISASSDRDAGVSFFDTPVIFPEKFTLSLDDGRKVTVDRAHDKKNPEPPRKTEGRWLFEKSVAYIKVPSFHGIETQAQALTLLKEFHDAKTVILDVRGNPGMGEPTVLQSALMGKPYHSWTESSSLHGGSLLRGYDASYPEHSTITTSEAVLQAFDSANMSSYGGRLILLTDRICSCACEDFVMPFKYSKRATLVGETTAGTFSFTRYIPYDNGMILNIAAVHHTFPDGSQFEGVGITPDVPVYLTPADLHAGSDPVLQRALALSKQP